MFACTEHGITSRAANYCSVCEQPDPEPTAYDGPATMIYCDPGDPITVTDRHGDEYEGFYAGTTTEELRWKRTESAGTTLSLYHGQISAVTFR